MPARPGLIATLFVAVMKLAPRTAGQLWQRWYQSMAQHDPQQQLRFMNYGYAIDPPLLKLDAADESERCAIQLYEQLLTDLDLAGKTVVEIGSGRGGGADALYRYHRPARVIAIDYAESASRLSHRRFPPPGPDFVTGDATALPLRSACADIAINVESSHCYPDFSGFVNEVQRILRPGGIFALCDLRSRAAMENMKSEIAASGLELQQARDITPAVLAALDIMAVRRKQLLAQVPRFWRRTFADFAGLPGTAVYNALREGSWVYSSLRYRKRSAADPLMAGGVEQLAQ